MKKHITNEHGLNLVKYMVHKTNLENTDNNKRQKCKNRAFVTLSHHYFFWRCEALQKV
jgi:hypothetical protein